MFGAYRTILALMVVALHLGGIPKIGTYAVFGFYCLSGYLMTLIMQTKYGYTISGIRKYAINRFLRIFPIYWISISISFVLILLLGNDYTYNYHSSIILPKTALEYIKNICILFPHMGGSRLTPPAWALTVELFFYILIGLGISKNKLTTQTWFILSVLYHLIAAALSLDTYFTIFAASLPFSIGALIFHHQEFFLRILDKKLSTTKILPIILLLLIFSNWILGCNFNHLETLSFYINLILCSCMIISLLNKENVPLINKKQDKWLGDFSYPIYLMHYQVGITVIFILSTLGIEIKRPELSLFIISTPIIILISWLITVFIERPIEKIRTKVKE